MHSCNIKFMMRPPKFSTVSHKTTIISFIFNSFPTLSSRTTLKTCPDHNRTTFDNYIIISSLLCAPPTGVMKFYKPYLNINSFLLVILRRFPNVSVKYVCFIFHVIVQNFIHLNCPSTWYCISISL